MWRQGRTFPTICRDCARCLILWIVWLSTIVTNINTDLPKHISINLYKKFSAKNWIYFDMMRYWRWAITPFTARLIFILDFFVIPNYFQTNQNFWTKIFLDSNIFVNMINFHTEVFLLRITLEPKEVKTRLSSIVS